MLNIIFAKKIGMGLKYAPDGRRLGVTSLRVPKIEVSGMRTAEKNGYKAVALKLQNSSHKFSLKEVRVKSDFSDLETGTIFEWDKVFVAGDKVKVTGTTKGRGFSGVVKKYHFKGGPRTHGQSDRERSRGSSGPTTTPGRVLPGKKMAGRMGNQTQTIKGLRVIEVDGAKGVISLSGPVPGSGADWVRIEKYD